MPTKGTLTKLRVKRRKLQFLSKNAKRKTRAVKSMRKHRKSMKKWMRGGGVEQGWQDDKFLYGRNNHKGGKKYTVNAYELTAYVLYDEIPVVNRRSKTNANMYMYVPVCVIFVKPVTPLDEIYLVFNRKITAEDITLTVKLLLGIDAATEFQLTPPITIPETTSNSLMGDTFVKICRSGGFSLSYGIRTGHYDSNTQLDTVDTTKHEIITKDTKYTSLDGKKIKASLDDAGDNGFKNRVLTSKGVLPNLYKGYFIAQEKPKEMTDETDETEVGKLFGEDLEPTQRPWNDKAEPYEVFKKSMMALIRANLLDMKHHNTYGLDPETVERLNQTRPLKITSPKIIYERLDGGDIISSIQDEVIDFTTHSEKWWNDIEKNYMKEALDYVSYQKEVRVNYCIEHPTSTDCWED
jgi:hypothetical protein